MGLIEEFDENRASGNDIVSAEGNLLINRFFALDTRAYDEGAIPVKYKEMMGLVGSMVLRCNDCIAYHIKKSYESGCSRAEVVEAMNIALIIGGSIVIPHLRYGFKLLSELYGDKL